MLLPAAGLIIAAAPATERRRCRGRPPAVPALAVPALSAPTPPCRHSRQPSRIAPPEFLFETSVQQRDEEFRNQKRVFLVTNEV